MWADEKTSAGYQNRSRPKKKLYGSHDVIVIAHNGKCAERITSRMDASSRVNRLLRTVFDDKPARDKMTLNAIYSLVVGMSSVAMAGTFRTEFSANDKLDDGDLQGAFVKGSEVLAWVCNNSRKYEKQKKVDVEYWTLLSTPGFGKKHKVPQEAIAGTPTEKLVIAAMLREFCRFLCKVDETKSVSDAAMLDDAVKRLDVRSSRLQLWGAGVPMNVWRADGDRGLKKHFLKNCFRARRDANC